MLNSEFKSHTKFGDTFDVKYFGMNAQIGQYIVEYFKNLVPYLL